MKINHYFDWYLLNQYFVENPVFLARSATYMYIHTYVCIYVCILCIMCIYNIYIYIYRAPQFPNPPTLPVEEHANLEVGGLVEEEGQPLHNLLVVVVVVVVVVVCITTIIIISSVRSSSSSSSSSNSSSSSSSICRSRHALSTARSASRLARALEGIVSWPARADPPSL